MRVAFTLLFNGLHHLLHQNQYLNILKKFDKWIVIEGACDNQGSTSWVKGSNKNFHKHSSSIDGSLEFMLSLKKQFPEKIHLFTAFNRMGMWASKDEMVNEVTDFLRENYGQEEIFLWQIDVDEIHIWEFLNISEYALNRTDCNCMPSKFKQYVGRNLIAHGPNWGGNTMNRLWKYTGQKFISHEPAVIENQKCISNEFDYMFGNYEHYSYYFAKDVEFKAKWYYDDMRIYKNWLKLQTLPKEAFPQPLSILFPEDTYSHYNKDANIFYIEKGLYD